jgi:hypothetical protein
VIQITLSIAKTRPPKSGEQFASDRVAAEITSDIGSLDQVETISKELYQRLESEVDRQLGQKPELAHTQAAGLIPRNGNGHRFPGAATQKQKSFLKHLVNEIAGEKDVDSWCRQNFHSDLAGISKAAAGEAIERLQGMKAASGR